MLKLALKWVREQSIQTALGSVAVVSLGFFLYIWKLGSWVSGFSPAELLERGISSSAHLILRNPLFAPHKLLQWVIQHFGFHGPFSLRLVSVAFTLVFIACFYFVAYSWYGKLMAFFSTLVFLSTPIILVLSRSATPDILYLWTVVLAAAYTWLLRTKSHGNFAWMLLLVCCLAAIYIPGLIWFVLAGSLFVRGKLFSVIKQLPKKITALSILILLAILAPMVWACFHNHELIKQVIGIPAHFGHIKEIIKSVGWAGLSFIWRIPTHSAFVLGRLPILNVLQIVLLGIGVFALWSHAKRRVYSLLGTMVLAILISGLNSSLSILIASLPAISLLIGVGLRYLFVEWKEIFPRNPLPHYFAIILITGIVGVHLYFGIRYALVAWPHSVATTSLYMLR